MPNRLAEVVVTPRGNYINYQGGETYIPTLEEYIRAEAGKKSVNAVYNILNQKTPVVPIIPDQGIISRIAGKFGMSDEERIDRFGKCEDPLTCINTVTAMYGQDSIVSGNKTFADNPERYGFAETDTPGVGDIMQFYNKGIPHHATMITGFNIKNQPVLSYSNGSTSEYSTDKDGHLVKSMKYDNDNWNPNWVEEDDRTSLYSIGNKTKVYKFVGTEKDKQKWENEYNKKYPKHKLGNKIRFHQNGGKAYYIKSLDNFIQKNPQIYGINTKDFRDFFIELVDLESSYRPNAKNDEGSYSGWYATLNGANLSEYNQHKAAFKHLSKLFKENITDVDLITAKNKGITQAQLLAKYWNQGNRVTNYIHNNVDDSDGLGTKISEYGNDINIDLDYSRYVPEAITDSYVIVKDSKTLPNSIVRFRNEDIDYSDRENSVINTNKDVYKKKGKKEFNPNKVQVGDTIWGINPFIPNPPKELVPQFKLKSGGIVKRFSNNTI